MRELAGAEAEAVAVRVAVRAQLVAYLGSPAGVALVARVLAETGRAA